MHQGEADNDAHRPERQQREQRQRSINSQKGFATLLALDNGGQVPPWGPRKSIKQSRRPDPARDPSRQNDGLEHIPKDARNQQYSKGPQDYRHDGFESVAIMTNGLK